MGSEIELKYSAPCGFSKEDLFSLPEIAPFCGEVSEIFMKTEYLDTKDETAKKHGITLRRRYENGESVLYAKSGKLRMSELSIRGEWSVSSDDLTTAAEQLLAVGAPTEALVGLSLTVVGKVEFKRYEAKVELPGAISFMLSFDEGMFGGKVPFSEVELELLAGSEDELLRFGRELSVKYDLSPEERSKYARAIICG